MELLLRKLFACSVFESDRFREKKEAFDAVMGVLGVLVVTRRGGGVTWPSMRFGSCKAAIFEAVGVLSGNRFRGGSRSGCKFFFLTGWEFLCWSMSIFDGAYFRVFGSCSFRNGSRIEPRPERLFVEILLILLASYGMLDFRGLKNGWSAGDSLGDSYALGIAGTGGTSCSSSFPAELCILGFGVGNLEEFGGGGNCGIRGCNEPIEVQAVL